MAAFAHWRVKAWAGNIDGYIYLSRLKLLDASGSPVSDSPTSEAVTNAGPAFTGSLWDDDVTELLQSEFLDSSSAVGFDFQNPVIATVELSAAAEVAFLQVEVAESGQTTPAQAHEYGFAIEVSADGIVWEQYGYWERGTFAFNTDALATLIPRGAPNYRAARRKNFVGNGGIFGIVTEDGVPKPGTNVYLFERQTFNKYRQTQSDDIGGYKFEGIDENREWLLFAVDNDGAQPKNAIVHDRIQPISLLSGTEQDNAFVVARLDRSDFHSLFTVRNADLPYVFGGNTAEDFHAWRVALEAGRAQPGNVSDPDPLVAFYQPGSSADGAVAIGFRALEDDDHRLAPDAFSGEAIFVFPDSGGVAQLNIKGSSSSYEEQAYGGLIFLLKGANNLMRCTAATDDMPNQGDLESNKIGDIPMTPGVKYHMAFSYLEGQHLRVLINGTDYHDFPIGGRGALGNSRASEPFGSPRFGNSGYWDVPTPFPYIRWMFWSDRFRTWSDPPSDDFRGGPMALYSGSKTQTQLAALHDLYVNASPPLFSTLENVIAQDMPDLWFRLNSPDNVQPEQNRLGSAVGIDFTATGIDYAEPGVAPGEIAAGFRGGHARMNAGVAQCDRFTLEAFIELDQLPPSGTAVVCEMENNSGSDTMRFFIAPDGKLHARVDNGDTYFQFATDTGVMAANVGYHIVWRHDPVTLQKTQIVVNNVVEFEGPVTHYLRGDQTLPFTIGNRLDGTQPLNGVMHDWVRYPYWLPDDRLQAHYDYWQAAT